MLWGNHLRTETQFKYKWYLIETDVILKLICLELNNNNIFAEVNVTGHSHFAVELLV